MRVFIDRVLKLFGLMRVKRAERMFIELAILHNKGILKYVWEDFNVPPKANHEQETRDWASTAWKEAMQSKLDKDWFVLER